MTGSPEIALRPRPLSRGCAEATTGGAAVAKWALFATSAPRCVLGGVASLKSAGGCRPSCIPRRLPLPSVPPWKGGGPPAPILKASENPGETFGGLPQMSVRRATFTAQHFTGASKSPSSPFCMALDSGRCCIGACSSRTTSVRHAGVNLRHTLKHVIP